MKKVIFGYTENCGTCKMAKEMLYLANHTFNIEVEELNLSLEKDLIKKHRITSTPAFIFMDGDEVVSQFYAFHSVTYLFEKLGELAQK